LGDFLWPTNGHSGLDIYVDDTNENGDGPPSGERYTRWATSAGNNPGLVAQIASGKTEMYTGIANLRPGITRNVTIYLPLWNKVTSIAIGVVPGEGAAPAQLPVPSAAQGRVVWYGTSIMHGAAASRPGVGWVNQAERMLNLDGVNLGGARFVVLSLLLTASLSCSDGQVNICGGLLFSCLPRHVGPWLDAGGDAGTPCTD
jgi:hypothetical protein